jgi:hypothetical protein
MLVFKSGYIDIIWKAVELSMKEGYEIDGISTYVTTIGDPPSGTVNIIVVLSEG